MEQAACGGFDPAGARRANLGHDGAEHDLGPLRVGGEIEGVQAAGQRGGEGEKAKEGGSMSGRVRSAGFQRGSSSSQNKASRRLRSTTRPLRCSSRARSCSAFSRAWVGEAGSESERRPSSRSSTRRSRRAFWISAAWARRSCWMTCAALWRRRASSSARSRALSRGPAGRWNHASRSGPPSSRSG